MRQVQGYEVELTSGRRHVVADLDTLRELVVAGTIDGGAWVVTPTGQRTTVAAALGVASAQSAADRVAFEGVYCLSCRALIPPRTFPCPVCHEDPTVARPKRTQEAPPLPVSEERMQQAYRAAREDRELSTPVGQAQHSAWHAAALVAGIAVVSTICQLGPMWQGVFATWCFLLICCGRLANTRGYSGVRAAAAAAWFSPIYGLFWVLSQPVNTPELERRQLDSGDWKRCARCHELIRSEAVGCKHCGADQPRGPRDVGW